jgi:hypothetical protein
MKALLSRRLLVALLLLPAGLVLPAAVPESQPPAATASGRGVVASFAGLDRDSIDAPGTRSFPPDIALAVGPSHLLQATNKGVRLSDRDGVPVASLPLADFFGAPADGGQVYDPKVMFEGDPARPRFYAVAVQTDFDRRTSSLHLAVSRGSEPADLAPQQWCRYRLQGIYRGTGRNAGGPGWADYPNLGAGGNALILTSSHYSFGDNAFTYAVVRVLDKRALVPAGGGCGTLRVTRFQPAQTFGDREIQVLQPVRPLPPTTADATPPAYLVATGRPPSNRYRIWRFVNGSGGTPVLQRVEVAGPSYDLPPAVPQLGSRLLLQTGDARVLQAVAVGNWIWAAHSTACSGPAGPGGAPAACARVVRLQVGSGAGGALTGRFVSETTLGGEGVHYWLPSVAVNRARQIGVVFLASGTERPLGSVWTWKTAAAPRFLPIRRLAEGDCGRAVSNRAGDFLSAQADPVDQRTFWFAGERAWNLSGSCAWQTWIARTDPAVR